MSRITTTAFRDADMAQLVAHCTSTSKIQISRPCKGSTFESWCPIPAFFFLHPSAPAQVQSIGIAAATGHWVWLSLLSPSKLRECTSAWEEALLCGILPQCWRRLWLFVRWCGSLGSTCRVLWVPSTGPFPFCPLTIRSEPSEGYNIFCRLVAFRVPQIGIRSLARPPSCLLFRPP